MHPRPIRFPLQYHLARNAFLCTAGLAIAIPPLSTASVSSSWNLLKLSERISNVPEGVRARVMNRSNPCAKSNELDSSNAGDEVSAVAPSTYSDQIQPV